MRSALIVLLVVGWLVGFTRSTFASVAAYDVVAKKGGQVLLITAVLAPVQSPLLSVQDGAEAFVARVQVLHPPRRIGRKRYPAHWVTLPRTSNSWALPRWATHGCRLRYTCEVGAACRQLHDLALASVHGPVYHICPEAFLLQPWEERHGVIRFAVHTRAPIRFVTGVTSVAPNLYETRATDLELGPDAAFGPLSVRALVMPGARFRLAYVANSLPMHDDALRVWVRRTALQVARYFQRFPSPDGLVLVLPSADDDTVAHARGGSGWSVCLAIGRKQTAEDIRHDTTLTHELVHVCTPGLHEAQHWMEEGIAVYLQHIIPAQYGTVSSAQVWKDLMDDLPRGQPCRGDLGLNQNMADDRTYYGGAMFWLLADLEIRRLSEGERTLRDALLAFNEAGGDITTQWHVQQLLHVGDQAIGAPVLHGLYARMAARPYKPNLPRLWKKLGVVREGRSVRFRSTAPMAHLRKALTVTGHGRRTRQASVPPYRARPPWFAQSLELPETVLP